MNRVLIPFGEPNELQKRVLEAFRNGKRFVQMVSGRQAGKSHLGARWLLAETANSDSKNKLGLVVAPTYRMARVARRKLDEVLKVDMRLWKRIKFTSQPIPTYEFPNGWVIEVHSTDDPDALRGPTASRVWHDEAAKSVGEAFDVLTPTLLAEEGKYLATSTSRGKHNWTYEKLYLPSCPPGHPEHDPTLYSDMYETVMGSTWDNVDNLSAMAITELERQYGGKDSAYARQEIYGEFISFEGLVYKWDIRNFIPVKNFPERRDYSMVIGGIDWGWTDAACAVVLGYKDGMWFALDGVYESGLSINDFALHIADLQARYQVALWYADSADPGRIEDLNSRGLKVRPVVKPLIEDRIRELAMFADHDRFKVSYHCPWLRDEFQMYQYPPEDKLLKDRYRRPVDKFNHALDAVGYVTWSVRHLWRNDVRYKLSEDREEEDLDDEKVYLKLRRKERARNERFGPSGRYGQ